MPTRLHRIQRLERLADVVAVMAAGRIVARGTPAQLVAEPAGRSVLEVYRPPARLAEVSEEAARRAWLTRRSGPAVAILRAEDLDGDAPEGVPRAATLEDAFVVLTGEEIA